MLLLSGNMMRHNCFKSTIVKIQIYIFILYYSLFLQLQVAPKHQTLLIQKEIHLIGALALTSGNNA